MRLLMLCVGRLKEKHFAQAAAEYEKRLRRFGQIETVEIPDLPEPKHASLADIAHLLDQEGEKLLARVQPRDHLVALCVGGPMLDSPCFAARLASLEMAGTPRAVFVIGSSNGLAPAVLSRANERLSMSAMTFPHQLARVMLLEQLYRARKIQAGETYHK